MKEERDRLTHQAKHGFNRRQAFTEGERHEQKTIGVWHSMWVAFIAVWLMAGSAFAHHGWSQYDANKTLNLTGVIKEAGYSNPHGLIRLQVDGENGKMWVAVLAPPSRMSSRGLSQEMLKVGTTATVVGYPHRELADEIRAERITIAGRTLELR